MAYVDQSFLLIDVVFQWVLRPCFRISWWSEWKFARKCPITWSKKLTHCDCSIPASTKIYRSFGQMPWSISRIIFGKRRYIVLPRHFLSGCRKNWKREHTVPLDLINQSIDPSIETESSRLIFEFCAFLAVVENVLPLSGSTFQTQQTKVEDSQSYAHFGIRIRSTRRGRSHACHHYMTHSDLFYSFFPPFLPRESYTRLRTSKRCTFGWRNISRSTGCSAGCRRKNWLALFRCSMKYLINWLCVTFLVVSRAETGSSGGKTVGLHGGRQESDTKWRPEILRLLRTNSVGRKNDCSKYRLKVLACCHKVNKLSTSIRKWVID